MAHVRRQGAWQVSGRPPRQQQQEGWIWRQRRHHQNSVDQLGSGLRRDIQTHEYFCKWNSEIANIFMVEGEMPHKPPISFFQKKDANLMATANRPSPFCAQRRCRWCPVMSAVVSQLFLLGERRHKSSHYPGRGGRSSTALKAGTACRRCCCLAMFCYWSRIGCPRENSGSSRA